MTPSPGAGGLDCLLVPLHLLTSYSLIRYFATPQHLENPQKEAQYSLANRVVQYNPDRHTFDPRNADDGGESDGQGGDRRRPRDRASSVVAKEETTVDSARKQLVDSSTLANSPSPPTAAATASASGNNAGVSLVAGSEHVDEIETKVECGAKVEQPNSKLSSSNSTEPTRVRFGGGTPVTTAPLQPPSSSDAAEHSAAPSSSPSSSSPVPQKVDAASPSSSVDSPVVLTADSAALPTPSAPSRAVAPNFATDVAVGNSLDFVEEEPKQAVNVATTVSPGAPVAGKTTLAAARLKRSPSLSPSTSTISESLRSNEDVVGVVEPVLASTVDSAQRKIIVSPADSAALPNTPSPEEESKTPAEIETGLECEAQLEQLGRQVEHVQFRSGASPLNEATPTKRSRSPSSRSWSLSTAVQLFVRQADQTLTASVHPGAPVAALLNDVAARTGMESTDFFLLSGGEVLRSDATIADYDLASGSQLFLCERLVGGAGQGVKRPRIEMTEENWSELAKEEAEWRADQEDRYCEGWGDGCGGEHAHEDDDENMDGVDYSYDSSEEDEDAQHPRAGCQKEPRTMKQRMADLREKNKLLREENEKVKKANRNYFDENARLKKAKKDLEKELERLQNAKCSCTARKSKPKKKAPAIVKTSDDRHARLRAGRREVDVADGDPLEAEYLALWHDRPIANVFAPTPIDEASQDLHLVNVPLLDKAVPDALFKLDPACVGGKDSLFACAKRVNMPVRFDRQFPGYVGEAFFKVFLEIVGSCDRFLFDLFTISNDYLPTLLTCNSMVDWASNPNASALLRCSHAVASRLYTIVQKANSVLKACLLERGVSQSEASRPRLLVQMLWTDGCASYHSKTLTGISKDGVTLYIWDGSANPSKRGFGSTATDSAGAPVKGSSHETKPLLAVPALSIIGQRHLAELDRFELFLARQQRLLRTNEETTRPITQVKSVEQAESTLKGLRKDAGIDKAEADVNRARSSAWSQRFLEMEPLKLTRSGPEEIPSGEPASINSLSSSTTTFRPPLLFKKLFIQEGTDAKSGQWAAKKAEPGEELEEVYLLCADCGSVVLGMIPPSQMASFHIRHLPLGVGCPEYLGPTRGILLSKSTTTQQDLEGLLQGLQDDSFVEPISGARIYNPMLAWYRSLRENLTGHDEIRESIRRFFNPLPPNHPYRYLLSRLLDANERQLSGAIHAVLRTVTTERRYVYVDGKQTTSVTAGCLAEAVRFTYEKSAKSTKAKVEKIPADVFWLPIDEAKRNEGDEMVVVEEEEEEEEEDEEDEFDHS